jgi:hypothetical protein
MQYFLIKTLVDITKTDVHKESIDPLKKKQQDNFQTLHQTLEMRGNVYFDKIPLIINSDWSEFGYSKKEKTWIWEVYTEQDDIFNFDGDPVGAMRQDIEYIPFNVGCRESVKFKHNVFSSKKKPTNILFELIDK